jgi:hypothetical protein
MSRGSEIKLKMTNINTSVGTIDNKENKKFYLKLSTWLTHVDYLENYNTNISKLNKKVKMVVNNEVGINTNFNNALYDISYRGSLNKNFGSKPFFINMEFTINNPNRLKINDLEINKLHVNIYDKINNIIKEDNNFKLT